VKEEKPKATRKGERELRIYGREYLTIAVILAINVSGGFVLRRKQNNEQHIWRMPTHTYLIVYLLTYLFTYLLSYLLTYLFTYLLSYLLTHIFTYLFTY